MKTRFPQITTSSSKSRVFYSRSDLIHTQLWYRYRISRSPVGVSVSFSSMLRYVYAEESESSECVCVCVWHNPIDAGSADEEVVFIHRS